MLGRSHSSGINVHVGINLDSSNFKTGGFEEETSTGCFEVSLALASNYHLPMTPLPIPLHDQLTCLSQGQSSLRDDSSTNKDVFDHIEARFKAKSSNERVRVGR